MKVRVPELTRAQQAKVVDALRTCMAAFDIGQRSGPYGAIAKGRKVLAEIGMSLHYVPLHAEVGAALDQGVVEFTEADNKLLKEMNITL